MKKELFSLLAWLIMTNLNGQIIQLASPASGVATTAASGISYSWSMGEIMTFTASNTSKAITQGQQQPNFKVAPPTPEPKVNNGLTVGDAGGKNGVLFIEELDKYPNNRLTIVNRWGEVLYKKDEPYKNDWAGTDATGSLVETGTYYYVFYPDVSKKTSYKGFILVIKP